MEVGLKATVTPVGWPLAVRAMAALKPPATVVEICGGTVELPFTIESEVGAAAKVKLGVAVEEPVRVVISAGSRAAPSR